MQYTDIFELSRTRGELSGELAAQDLPALASLIDPGCGGALVHWSAVGTAGRNDLPGADLTIDAQITTRCVRCGEPVTLVIRKTVPFLFVKSEKEADAIPIEDDGDYEIVVGSRKFDLAAWVEEELILSLPAFAQHDDCAPPAEHMHDEGDPAEAERANPFACLAELKRRR